MGRIISVGLTIAGIVGASSALGEESDDTLRFFLSKADLVVLGTIDTEPLGIVPDDEEDEGPVDYRCRFRVAEVLKGTEPDENVIRVGIAQFEAGAKDRSPLLDKGSECILFLNGAERGKVPGWRTSNAWFAVQRPGPSLVRSIKRLSKTFPKAAPPQPNTFPNIDRLDEHGSSQLHVAAASGDVEEVKKLLEAGANVAVKHGKSRGAPLHFAAACGNLRVVKLLLDHMAPVDPRDADGKTPLMVAVASTQADIDVVELLLERGADVNATTKTNWTALHYAHHGNYKETAKLLIASGADPTARDADDKLPEQVERRLHVPDGGVFTSGVRFRPPTLRK